ncbi:radiation sensitive protein rad9 [Cryomyces antarcticus]|uniref:Radiation sensitive protein rad9 n=1 Tax=Cryomyces antarcticus TaxID=329879 RepID=A0ABR0KQB7_9PEZI|nr:radiation sensitive protein rad9 [Cryomyces antarcticus]
MVDARPKLLDGRSVLLVTGKGRIEEKRKVYVFLTRALGAKRVAKAANIELAKNMLEEGQQDWDLVYVDGPEKQAEKFLFGTINGEVDSIVAAGAGKKRKRGDEDEQSLILGALLEQ